MSEDAKDKRIAELERQLDSATEFLIDGPPTEPLSIYIRKCFGYRLPKEPMWKVMRGGQGGPVLAKDGEWELEPIPSSRDDEFYARCRFDTYDEALAAVEAGKRSIDAARKETK